MDHTTETNIIVAAQDLFSRLRHTREGSSASYSRAKRTATAPKDRHRPPFRAWHAVVLLAFVVGLTAGFNTVQADDVTPAKHSYQPPPNIPHTTSVILFTRYHHFKRKQQATQHTPQVAQQAVQQGVQKDDDADSNDDLSIAPWVETGTYNPDTGETQGQSLSNLEYDKILKDSPIDKGFGTAQVADIWERVRKGFGLSGYEHARVDRALRWYSHHKQYLDRVTERAKPFFYYILQEIDKRHMPTEFALLPIVESAFQPFAYSPGRAAGLWQFIPETAKHYGLKLSWWYDGRRDVYLSTQAALDYLVYLHDHFHGNWLNALAAYNSGQGTVDRAIRDNLQHGKGTDFWSLDLPKETRGYVPKLLAVASLIADPKAYHLTMNPIPNRPYFERIDVKSQIDLARAAEMANMTIEQLYTLNPAFNRWATDPDGPHYLIIPLKNADRFLNKLALLKPRERIQWRRHKITAGESLSGIAAKYQTTVALLKVVNNLKGKKIRSGKSLIIPFASRSLKDYTLTADARRKTLQNHARAGQKLLHVIQQGDSFWDLAQKYGVTMKKLARWNGMSPRDPLVVGKTLVIWTDSNTDTATDTHLRRVSFTAVSPPHNATSRTIRYHVREGDSLYVISQKFHVTIAQLRKWNSLEDGQYLHPGQSLKIYVDITQLSENN